LGRSISTDLPGVGVARVGITGDAVARDEEGQEVNDDGQRPWASRAAVIGEQASGDLGRAGPWPWGAARRPREAGRRPQASRVVALGEQGDGLREQRGGLVKQGGGLGEQRGGLGKQGGGLE
jgi:hypothetical protein